MFLVVVLYGCKLQVDGIVYHISLVPFFPYGLVYDTAVRTISCLFVLYHRYVFCHSLFCDHRPDFREEVS